jgi:hypothetical protein
MKKFLRFARRAAPVLTGMAAVSRIIKDWLYS